MTLEDETGLVNLVVWRPVFERYHLIAKTALMIEVIGKLEHEQGVVHLIADRLSDPKLPRAIRREEIVPPGSRDFH
jgi:error-prone DNA polymerase